MLNRIKVKCFGRVKCLVKILLFAGLAFLNLGNNFITFLLVYSLLSQSVIRLLGIQIYSTIY